MDAWLNEKEQEAVIKISAEYGYSTNNEWMIEEAILNNGIEAAWQMFEAERDQLSNPYGDY